MEVAWSTMWNVTDETAVNCERFLDGNGMEYFLGCLNVSYYCKFLGRLKFFEFLFNDLLNLATTVFLNIKFLEILFIVNQ
jgi:hypothetical protein